MYLANHPFHSNGFCFSGIFLCFVAFYSIPSFNDCSWHSFHFKIVTHFVKLCVSKHQYFKFGQADRLSAFGNQYHFVLSSMEMVNDKYVCLTFPLHFHLHTITIAHTNTLSPTLALRHKIHACTYCQLMHNLIPPISFGQLIHIIHINSCHRMSPSESKLVNPN